MKIVLLGLCGALLAWGAGKGKCTDPGVQWEVRTTYVDETTLNAIQADSGSPYVNGLAGVQAVIDVCGGTQDAKLVLLADSTGTRRDLFVSFARVLATNSLTPAWTTGPPVGCKNICWLLNIRNLGFVPAGNNRINEYDFTTHLTSGGPNNAHITMVNPSVDAQPPNTTFPANNPDPNAKVRVHHCPATFTGTSSYCTAGTYEQWFVWPESTSLPSGSAQVATLNLDSKGPTKLDGGEFSIPFYLVITALQ